MGEIINSKASLDKSVTFKILLENNEMRNLKGHLKKIRLFHPEKCTHEAQINTRGNNGVTKYFKIPLSIRSRKKQNGELSYQKIITSSQIFYVYTLKKE